ncbi:DUF6493 family protein [Actinomadura yumaensis]|uniref:DUF6493 family protein n=1 Tax=Actinomadura yumaensis TaxID=111807 RepID=UPI00361A48F9
MLRDDPWADVLLPRVFEVDGLGALLSEEWPERIAALAEEGRFDRKPLLDGCVSRFLRGGEARDLRWFVALHDALAPTPDESFARLRDHVRLLPASPAAVAEMALREVRRADDDGRLGAAEFAEAADALLFRPEKKLVRAALTWLDRTARKRGRVDATLAALTAVFPSEALDLRERAVKGAVRHAAHVTDEQTGAAVREAAAVLPADLREAVAAAFGEVEEPEAGPPVPPGLPPFTPRTLPPPIGSPAELAEEFAARTRTESEWPGTERLVAGVVELAYRDADAVREALRRVLPDAASWEMSPHALDSYDPGVWATMCVRTLFDPKPKHGLVDARGILRHGRSWTRGDRDVPVLDRFLRWRLREASAAVRRAPVLLATPTEGSGHIDPGVLVSRLERLEAAGADPGRADLAQALLRLPRDAADLDGDAVSRAARLPSKAGRAVAAWLASGGLADPDVECATVSLPSAGAGTGAAGRSTSPVRSRRCWPRAVSRPTSPRCSPSRRTANGSRCRGRTTTGPWRGGRPCCRRTARSSPRTSCRTPGTGTTSWSGRAPCSPSSRRPTAPRGRRPPTCSRTGSRPRPPTSARPWSTRSRRSRAGARCPPPGSARPSARSSPATPSR